MATLYFLYSRALTCAPLSVPSHQWDVRSVLEIHAEKQCIGWAPSKRRKCTCAISSQNWESLKSLTHKIGEQPPDAEELRSQLERLAYLGLCVRFHRGTQVASMVEKWTPKIDAIARAAEHASISTPDSPLTPQPRLREPSQRTQAIPTAISDSASSPERIQPVSATPFGLPSPRPTPPPGPAYSSRTLYSRTGNMSLPVPQATMAALYESDEALLQAADQSLHARRRLTLGSLSIPRSPSLESYQRTQAIPTATPDSASSPERIQPVPAVTAASATSSGPPSHRTTLPQRPASPTTRCTRSHAGRRSLGDECPICYEGEPLSTFPASALTWCTSSCGRAVHTTCFTAWAEQSVLSGWKLNCPVCRADWTESCACGGRSKCDAVHVAKKGMEVPCPVCKEDMKRSGEGTSWCKDGCGQSVHKECMDTWKAYCLTNRNAVSCTMCRAVWTSECEC
jgi:hypothetical protein